MITKSFVVLCLGLAVTSCGANCALGGSNGQVVPGISNEQVEAEIGTSPAELSPECQNFLRELYALKKQEENGSSVETSWEVFGSKAQQSGCDL